MWRSSLRRSTPRCNYKTEYNVYRNRLFYNKTIFACPHQCGKTFTSNNFENHCTQMHGLNARSCCVWCFGVKSWYGDGKYHHASHLMKCWRNFISTRLRTSRCSKRACPSPVMKRMGYLPPRALEILWPVPLPVKPLKFSNLLATVHLYLKNQRNFSTSSATSLSLSTTAENCSLISPLSATADPAISGALTWFHIVIDKEAYSKFLKIMNNELGRFRTLPYSCWCLVRSSNNTDLKHRHLILVALPGKHFLPKIKIPLNDAIRVTLIRNVSDLIDVIGDVSDQRRIPGQCPLGGGPTEAYFATEPLPKGFRGPIILQLKNMCKSM